MKQLIETQKPQPTALIVGIQSPYNVMKNIESYFDEFRNLVRSSGRDYENEVFIKLREIDPATFITKGKLQEIADLCSKKGVQEVIISEPLSVAQERNLSEILGVPLIDRTHLILEIFERGAVSSEGKKQVALARFQYEKGRLAGKGLGMSQQTGRIGTKGPGITAKEKETQHLERMMDTLKADLAKLEQIRKTQRKQRVSSAYPLLCLVGYTNAGKSSILNGLTKSGVLAENKLFSTLDTTTRELYLDGKKTGIISDTVGFIQNLPHHLIEAFKSTLSELEYANLLLHVIDISDPNWQDHIRVVNNVLTELHVEKPILYVFNKIDKLSESDEQIKAQLIEEVERFNPHVLVSARQPHGLDPLIEFLKTWKKS